MRVAVIRHAIAEDRVAFADTGQDDALRPLTAQGRKKMRRAAAGLKAILPAIELVGASPLVRARETADIVAEQYGGLEVVELAALAPGAAPEDVLGWLQGRKGADAVALVGHEPDLGVLVGWLLTGRKGSFMDVKKGSACLLEFPKSIGAGTATLLWFLKPSQLIMLGGQPT